MNLAWLILGLAAVAFFTLPDQSPMASLAPWDSTPTPDQQPQDFTDYGGYNMGTTIDYDSIINREASPPPSILSYANFVSLIKSVIQIESAWNPSAVSSAGAIGLMQVMPANAIAYGYQPDDLYNPEINIKLGADILRTEINNYGLVDGLAAYNGGPKNRKIAATQAYAQNVLSVYNSMVG